MEASSEAPSPADDLGRARGHAIVVGEDRVALAICRRLAEFESDGCALLGCAEEAARELVARGAARLVAGDPADPRTLVAANIESARSILLLSANDRLNLQIAMRARDLNPQIRIVMRQFNRTLGRKVEVNLENTTVVSLAALSAAVFAAAAVDPANFYGVQFPDIDGPLFGFAERGANELGVAGETVAQAQARLECRILAAGGEAVDSSYRLDGNERLTTFTRLTSRSAGGKRRREGVVTSIARAPRAVRNAWRRADPLARRLTIVAASFYVIATAFFAFALHADPLTAAYFVLTTMTTTGYGDIVPRTSDHVEQVAAMVTMLGGVIFTGLFVALVTANFTQARYRAQQGVRRIDASGHIVVCGAGRVGSRVIDYLIALRVPLIVVEQTPGAAIVERARNREFALLTGDATLDSTLAFCNLAEAHALVALTQSDTMNLEVALGAQAISEKLPIVMRVVDGDFADSVARHFRIGRTFGAGDLVGPVLVALSFTANARGYVEIGGRGYTLSQSLGAAEDIERLAATRGTIVLAAFRDGRPFLAASAADLRPGDLALFLYPAYRYRKAG